MDIRELEGPYASIIIMWGTGIIIIIIIIIISPHRCYPDCRGGVKPLTITHTVNLLAARLTNAMSSPRCNVTVAYKEASSQDTQGAAQGRLYWSLASVPSIVLCGPRWTEGLPPSYRDQQKDLPHWKGRPIDLPTASVRRLNNSF